MYTDSSPQAIQETLEDSWNAFLRYRHVPVLERVAFLHAIAEELEEASASLVAAAMAETHLPEPRLKNELGRTCFQLRSYADACLSGYWLDIRIDHADANRTPPKPDLRKMNMPIGPVVVFGSSNFPFAYSTAGGDTASALAAGCTVVVKAHPAHPHTSTLAANCIRRAIQRCGLPEDTFRHVYGASHETGKALVTDPHTKAAGFTGSYGGGRALFDWANQRPDPIPVFAEMGSVNPVFLLPGKLEGNESAIAAQYAGSITLGVGQFCTNPGLIIGLAGESLDRFVTALGSEIAAIAPGPMLHEGIATSYAQKRAAALASAQLVAESNLPAGPLQGQPTIALASGAQFISNPRLHQEVFGPFSLVVACTDMYELGSIVDELEGQLTCTLMATEADLRTHAYLVSSIELICGRLILNGVPTGVEVSPAMQHGGPFPASTDARFGSVGADAIKRFVRPMSYQGWPDALLPAALQEANTLGYWRMVDGVLTQ
jgi:NADP-dependent aldehyde dehydrogenase